MSHKITSHGNLEKSLAFMIHITAIGFLLSLLTGDDWPLAAAMMILAIAGVLIAYSGLNQ